MQVISLFSGIGGFELAATWAGWDIVVCCEINPFGKRVLEYYWPNAYHHSDINTLNYDTIIKNSRWDPTKPTIVVGGFPCQGQSLAGKRKGREDERWLWPAMCRIIQEVSPQFVLAENVLGIISIESGLVFEQVQVDLEAEGYEVQPYVLPAAGVDAPHRRDRVWFVARRNDAIENPMHSGCLQREFKQEGTEVRQFWNTCSGDCQRVCISKRTTPHPTSDGLHEQPTEGNKPNGSNTIESGQGRFSAIEGLGDERITANPTSAGREERKRTNELIAGQYQRTDWRNFPTVSPICNIYDGISDILVRNINTEIYASISKRYTDKDLQEVWDSIHPEKIQRKIGGLYKIHEPRILFQILQLCSPSNNNKTGTSVWSEKTSEKILRKLREYGSLANTPQGRKLEQQFTNQFGDTLPKLSHEIALVAMETERAAISFASWHRNESIKAGGNAVVPPLVYQFFETINEYITTENFTK